MINTFRKKSTINYIGNLVGKSTRVSNSYYVFLNILHARFHTSFAQGVVGLNETQGKGGIHCLCLPEQLQKAESIQQFGENKKRL